MAFSTNSHLLHASSRKRIESPTTQSVGSANGGCSGTATPPSSEKTSFAEPRGYLDLSGGPRWADLLDDEDMEVTNANSEDECRKEELLAGRMEMVWEEDTTFWRMVDTTPWLNAKQRRTKAGTRQEPRPYGSTFPLPEDVLSVVAEFFVAKPADASLLSQVSWTFLQGTAASEELWDRLETAMFSGHGQRNKDLFDVDEPSLSLLAFRMHHFDADLTVKPMRSALQLSRIGNFEGLRSLDLSRCQFVCDLLMDSLAHSNMASTLLYINLEGCSHLTDRGFRHFDKFTSLNELNISHIGGRYSRGGSDSIHEIGEPISSELEHRLRELALPTTFTTDGFELLLSKCPNLKVITAFGLMNSVITQSTIAKIPSFLPEFERLEVEGN